MLNGFFAEQYSKSVLAQRRIQRQVPFGAHHQLHNVGEFRRLVRRLTCASSAFRRAGEHVAPSAPCHAYCPCACQEIDDLGLRTEGYRNGAAHPDRQRISQKQIHGLFDERIASDRANVFARNPLKWKLSIPSTRNLRQLWRGRLLTRIAQRPLRYNQCAFRESFSNATHPVVRSNAGVPFDAPHFSTKGLI